jgi:putative peptide zinc metalloprotease protein
VLDAVGMAVLEALDHGRTLREAVTRGGEGAVPEAVAFAEELRELGFVADVDGAHASARVGELETRGRVRWWSAFAGLAAFSLGIVVAALATHTVAAGHLLLPDASLGAAIGVLAALSSVTAAAHELAHVAVARAYGLSPRLGFSQRGLWPVAKTNLASLWSLPPRLQWRPVAAGLMVDVSLLAAALVTAAVTASAVADVAVAVLAARILWQAQWYLRTDVYYLFGLAAGAPALRDVARLQLFALLPLRRLREAGRSDLGAVPPSEVRAARIYLASLPLAALATVALWAWFLVPLLEGGMHV